MMRSILISIKPEWVAEILNQRKTIEVRKTAPKCELPIDVYIYCTKGQEELYEAFMPMGGKAPYQSKPKGYGLTGGMLKQGKHLNGKIVAKFTLKAVHKFDWRLVANPFFKVRGSCLGYDQLRKYATDKKGIVHDLYGWCISDLEIFDEPKELSEFYSLRLDKDVTKLFDNSIQLSNGKWVKRLSRPPESYCFVEVEE